MMKFRRFADIPLVFKVGLPPAFAVLMLAALVGTATWSQQRQEVVLEAVVQDATLRSQLADDSRRITEANGALFSLMTQQAAGGSPADAQKALRDVLAEIDAVRADLLSLQPHLPAAEQAGFAGVLADLSNYRGAIQVVGSMLSLDFNAAADFIQPFEANYISMTGTLDRASDDVAAASDTRARASTHLAVFINDMMIAFALGTLIAVAGVGWTVILAISQSVHQISRATESLASGDHDFDLEALQRQDEFGAIVRSLTVFRENQRRMEILRAEQQALEAREAEARLEQARNREAALAQQQAVVQNLAASLDALGAGNLNYALTHVFPASYEKLRLDFNVAIARLAETMRAMAASIAAMRGGDAEDFEVPEARAGGSMPADPAEALLQRAFAGAHAAAGSEDVAISEITLFCAEIAKIAGMIDEVAFQTNLLALNAGIEAARAGDSSRGFSLVATEVRALAARSGNSARQIKRLIGAAPAGAAASAALVHEVSGALADILAQVMEVSRLVGEISRAAKEQATERGGGSAAALAPLRAAPVLKLVSSNALKDFKTS